MQVRLAIIGGESRIIKGLTSTAVTSRVDVWIETDMESLDNILQFQNFMWMCELKLDQM